MKRILKLLIALSLILSLAGCASDNQQDTVSTTDTIVETDFDKYMDEAIIDILANDYHAIHVYFEKPENFGINKNELKVAFDSGFNEETNDKVLSQYEDIREKLETFDYNKLQDYQKDMYDSFVFDYNLIQESKDEKYEFLPSAYETSRGAYISYPTVLADWIVRSEQDYKDLIVLVKDIKRTFEEEIAYTTKQAENGYMHINFDDTITYCQNIVDEGINSSVLESLLNKVDTLTLDDEIKATYKEEMTKAFEESYLAGYEYLVAELTKLINDETLANNEYGLYYLPDGQEYYEIIMRQAIGMDMDVEEVIELLESTLVKYLQKMSMILQVKPELYDELLETRTNYDDVAKMLLDLEEDILVDFPDVGEIEYEIASIDPAIANANTAAYFNIPAVDGTYPKQIRVNTNDGQLDVGDISTFQTIAHEGLPGHMYQIYYNYQNAPTLFLKLNSCISYVEGYATYVENYVSKYLEDEMSKGILDITVANNIATGCIYALTDIAIHYSGFDVEEVKDLLLELGLDVDLETTQMIYNQLRDNPTMFLPYYVGFAKIDQLKAYAKEQLKDNFDEVEFHKALLDASGRSMDVVERCIDRYIETNK